MRNTVRGFSFADIAFSFSSVGFHIQQPASQLPKVAKSLSKLQTHLLRSPSLALKSSAVRFKGCLDACKTFAALFKGPTAKFKVPRPLAYAAQSISKSPLNFERVAFHFRHLRLPFSSLAHTCTIRKPAHCCGTVFRRGYAVHVFYQYVMVRVSVNLQGVKGVSGLVLCRHGNIWVPAGTQM